MRREDASLGRDAVGMLAAALSAGSLRPARQYPAAVERFGARGQRRLSPVPGVDVDTQRPTTWSLSAPASVRARGRDFWRRALGDNQKILILDNHDDFGGHAKRNEFTYHGRTFIGYGGTQSIATPYPYSYTAKRLVEELGVQVARNAEFQNREVFDEAEPRAGDVLRQGTLRRG